jgi:xanthine dehydrogenase accessory factor
LPEDFFARARELEARGEPFVTALVVRVERPTSGKPGDRALITSDGRLHGWVGGSCTRPTVLEVAREALRDGQSRLMRLATEPDEARREGMTDLAMTCFSGGTMEIFLEPHLPRPKLLLVGHQPLAEAVADLGRVMGYRVVGIDPGSGEVASAAEKRAPLKDLPQAVDPVTFVVVATHGEGDEVAVEQALRAGAPYVGLVASRKRAEAIQRYLKVVGLSGDDLAALRVPAGLDIQARRPEEIALSILAEIVQVRRGMGEIAWPEEAPGEVPTSERKTAIDPVCQMEVVVEGAQHTFEHGGTTYYFCCGGCRARFAESPTSFLGSLSGA